MSSVVLFERFRIGTPVPLRVDHAYPSDLAALVRHRWDEARAAGRTDLRPPDEAAVTALLSTCFEI